MNVRYKGTVLLYHFAANLGWICRAAVRLHHSNPPNNLGKAAVIAAFLL